MAPLSLKHSTMEMVNVYIGNEIAEQVTRESARAMKTAGTHFFINHGRDLRLLQSEVRTHKPDSRGSREQSGCLTARESELNTDYRGTQTDVALLSREFEHNLEKHILKGLRGVPAKCNVIAARVKTVLSNPINAGDPLRA